MNHISQFPRRGKHSSPCGRKGVTMKDISKMTKQELLEYAMNMAAEKEAAEAKAAEAEAKAAEKEAELDELKITAEDKKDAKRFDRDIHPDFDFRIYAVDGFNAGPTVEYLKSLSLFSYDDIMALLNMGPVLGKESLRNRFQPFIDTRFDFTDVMKDNIRRVTRVSRVTEAGVKERKETGGTAYDRAYDFSKLNNEMDNDRHIEPVARGYMFKEGKRPLVRILLTKDSTFKLCTRVNIKCIETADNETELVAALKKYTVDTADQYA